MCNDFCPSTIAFHVLLCVLCQRLLSFYDCLPCSVVCALSTTSVLLRLPSMFCCVCSVNDFCPTIAFHVLLCVLCQRLLSFYDCLPCSVACALSTTSVLLRLPSMFCCVCSVNDFCPSTIAFHVLLCVLCQRLLSFYDCLPCSVVCALSTTSVLLRSPSMFCCVCSVNDFCPSTIAFHVLLCVLCQRRLSFYDCLPCSVVCALSTTSVLLRLPSMFCCVCSVNDVCPSTIAFHVLLCVLCQRLLSFYYCLPCSVVCDLSTTSVLLRLPSMFCCVCSVNDFCPSTIAFHVLLCVLCQRLLSFYDCLPCSVVCALSTTSVLLRLPTMFCCVCSVNDFCPSTIAYHVLLCVLCQRLLSFYDCLPCFVVCALSTTSVLLRLPSMFCCVCSVNDFCPSTIAFHVLLCVICQRLLSFYDCLPCSVVCALSTTSVLLRSPSMFCCVCSVNDFCPSTIAFHVLLQFRRSYPDIYCQRFPTSESESNLFPDKPKIKPALFGRPLQKLRSLRL